MKRTAMGHPKLVRLAALLDVPPYAVVGVMECIWHFTQKHAITGNIGKWTDEEIAGQIGWDIADATKLIEALVACRLLDRHTTHRLVVHDWDEHCDESVTKTLRNKKLAFANRSEPVPANTGESPNDSKLFEKVLEQNGNVLPKPKPSQAIAKPTPSSSKLRSDPGDRELAQFMHDRIRDVDPKFREPNLESWANEVRLARERDQRTHEEIRAVFVWANADSFWRANILSPSKLREKFSELSIKMRAGTNGTRQPDQASRIRSEPREDLHVIRS